MTLADEPAPENLSGPELPQNSPPETVTETSRSDLPELPPVAPPSAGFIVQLFLVPAVIVAAVIGVWLLFGRIASDEQDVKRVVAELRSGNSHRRWRAAFNLAQILEADAHRSVDGRELTKDPEVARSLADLLAESLETDSSDVEELQQAAYLARALGWFDLPEIVLPPLQTAIVKGEGELPPGKNGDVVAELKQSRRVSALTSVAQIAGRSGDAGEPITNPDVVETIVEASTSNSTLIRQLSAYCLGLFPTDVATERLTGMLIDPDVDTRVNAAIGLARQESAAGLNVFLRVLSEMKAVGQSTSTEATSRDELERYILAKNSLKALQQIETDMPTDQQQEDRQVVAPWADEADHPEVKVAAEAVLQTLSTM